VASRTPTSGPIHRAAASISQLPAAQTVGHVRRSTLIPPAAAADQPSGSTRRSHRNRAACENSGNAAPGDTSLRRSSGFAARSPSPSAQNRRKARQARKKVVRYILIVAILHLRNGRLYQQSHGGAVPLRSDRQPAKVIHLPFMLGQHHADMPFISARAVKQMLAPGLRSSHRSHTSRTSRITSKHRRRHIHRF